MANKTVSAGIKGLDAARCARTEAVSICISRISAHTHTYSLSIASLHLSSSTTRIKPVSEPEKSVEVKHLGL
ncbi:hypothetical protein IRJ41_011053 [Triplophysa rosa]|uniref:Uncharacterized protein n=1 Tax=Triplophysa rosa TaxID=992332 RepID=A0A9W7TQT3_TRIRA|nr:hypothetical protein IRJ41_011053 [Triplophysa rosa]